MPIKDRSEVKERPILFSGEMVKVILEGRKTQTRRVMKPQPGDDLMEEYRRIAERHGVTKKPEEFAASCILCPYGQPGDRLWVRETWRAFEAGTGIDGILYRADNGFQRIENTREAWDANPWVWVVEFKRLDK